MSGILRSCSIEQCDNLPNLGELPPTPIKNRYPVTPKRSESKRTLFQSYSPTGSDDLGSMSPLSLTSESSISSLDGCSYSRKRSACYGKSSKNSQRMGAGKIKVTSKLFPDSKKDSPVTQRYYKHINPKKVGPDSGSSSCDELIEGLRSWPAFKASRRRLILVDKKASADSSSSIPGSCVAGEKESNESNDKPTKMGFMTIPPEQFYGPVPRPKLCHDYPESRGREKIRACLNKDSLSLNKDKNAKKTISNGSQRSRLKPSKGDRRKTPHPGVWHNIRKPHQTKKTNPPEKPFISPQARLNQMVKALPKKKTTVKPFFQENPRKRVAELKKRKSEDSDNGIIDHLIKRKKLPDLPVSTQTTVSEPEDSEPKTIEPEVLEPDPNKKFMKYKQTRKATFTLNDNVKLQISDGVMRLQSPKKRRKLCSAKTTNAFEDINVFDKGFNDTKQKVEEILNILQNDKEFEFPKNTNIEMEKIYENLQPLENRGAKGQRNPLKALSNLPEMIISDFTIDDSDENSPCSSNTLSHNTIPEKSNNLVSSLTNEDQNVEMSPCQLVHNIENSPPRRRKYFSLFYKQNWNKDSTVANVDSNAQKQSKKVFVPDNQYLLDAGQKSIGVVTCKKCGVMYQAGDFVDEATHTRFHNNLPELRFSGWHNERVVGKYSDGRVLMVLNTDPKVWWQKILKIAEIVDQELGFPEATLQSLFYKTVYLYINDKSKQIVGCLIAEECKVAYRMLLPVDDVEIDSCSKDPCPCKVGISRIWTALSRRRTGVASRMVECLQKTFYFGNFVPMDQIAFSAPSPEGKRLAQKVNGRMDFLVYGFP